MGVWDGYMGCMGLGEWSLSGGDQLVTGVLWDLHGESLWGLVWLDAVDRFGVVLTTKGRAIEW